MAIEMEVRMPGKRRPIGSVVLDEAIRRASANPSHIPVQISGPGVRIEFLNAHFVLREGLKEGSDGKMVCDSESPLGGCFLEDEITGLSIKDSDGTIRTLRWRRTGDNRGRMRRLTDAIKAGMNPAP